LHLYILMNENLLRISFTFILLMFWLTYRQSMIANENTIDSVIETEVETAVFSSEKESMYIVDNRNIVEQKPKKEVIQEETKENKQEEVKQEEPVQENKQEEVKEEEPIQENKQEEIKEEETIQENKQEEVKEEEPIQENKQEEIKEEEPIQENKQEEIKEEETIQENKQEEIKEEETIQENKQEEIKEEEPIQENKQEEVKEEEPIQENKQEEVKEEEPIQENKQEEIKEEEPIQENKQEEVKEEEPIQENKQEEIKEEETIQENKQEEIKEEETIQENKQEEVKEEEPIQENKQEEVKEPIQENKQEEVKEKTIQENKQEEVKKEEPVQENKQEEVKEPIQENKQEEVKEETIQENKQEEVKKEEPVQENKQEEVKEPIQENKQEEVKQEETIQENKQEEIKEENKMDVVPEIYISQDVLGEPIQAMAVQKNYIAVSGKSGHVVLIEQKSKQKINWIDESESESIEHLYFTQDEKYLFSVDYKGYIIKWNLENKKDEGWYNSKSHIESMALSNDGHLFSIHTTKYTRIYDFTSDAPKSIPALSKLGQSIVITSDTILSLSNETSKRMSSFYVYGMKNKKWDRKPLFETSDFIGKMISYNSDCLAWNQNQIFSLNATESLQNKSWQWNLWLTCSKNIDTIVYNEDGSIVGVIDADSMVTFYERITGKQLGTINIPSDMVKESLYITNAFQLILLSKNGNIYKIDIAF